MEQGVLNLGNSLNFVSMVSLIKPLDLGFYGSAILFLILLGFSALASGTEVALFSIRDKDLSKLNKSKNLSDILIIRLLLKPKKLLATVLITNNFVNIALVVLFTITLRNYFYLGNNELAVFIIEVLVITAFLVIFGELIPKMYAKQNNISFARSVVFTINLLVNLLSPFSAILVKWTKIIERRISVKNLNVSSSEMKQAIDITSEKGHNPDDNKILKRIVSFSNVLVKQVMTSRINVLAFEDDTPFIELLKNVNANRFSRVPVYNENLDNIVGILYLKDLLPYYNKDNNFQWKKLLRQPYFVPETKKIDDLLREFQNKKVHMAVVVDEYGGFSGIITLEDILEEIVGEITDEFDELTQLNFRKIDEKTYIFDAKTPINDFAKELGLPDEKFQNYTADVETLGGLMIELLGKIPLKGDKVVFEELNFIIESADKKKVNEVKITVG